MSKACGKSYCIINIFDIILCPKFKLNQQTLCIGKESCVGVMNSSTWFFCIGRWAGHPVLGGHLAQRHAFIDLISFTV
jgi:hypothetical protein